MTEYEELKALCGVVIGFKPIGPRSWIKTSDHEEQCDDCLDVKWGKDRNDYTLECGRELYAQVMASA